MPQPNPGDLHVNGLLTNISVAHVQDDSKFVADKVFPGVNVEKQSDLYATYNQADLMRDEMKIRKPGSESAGGGYDVDNTNSYTAVVRSIHKDVHDQERDNADDPYSPDQDAAMWLGQKVLINREINWTTKFFATSIWDTDRTGGTDFTQWDDVSSDPIGEITTQSAVIEERTGFYPNKLVVNRRVWNRLKNHPDFVDRVKHTSDDAVSRRLVAQLLELDDIHIAAGVRNTAGEGLTGSFSYIAGNHALLLYAAPSPGLYQPSAGYTFAGPASPVRLTAPQCPPSVWTTSSRTGTRSRRLTTRRSSARTSACSSQAQSPANSSTQHRLGAPL